MGLQFLRVLPLQSLLVLVAIMQQGEVPKAIQTEATLHFQQYQQLVEALAGVAVEDYLVARVVAVVIQAAPAVLVMLVVILQ